MRCTKEAMKPTLTGFTLLELLITIAVLSILMMVAMPSFKTMMMNNRISTTTDALVSALNYARHTALSKNTSVMICPWLAAGSMACGGSWSTGWIVISQPVPVLLSAYNTGSHDPVVSSTITSATFDSRGITTTTAQFTVCDNRGGTFARSVSVLPTGFVQAGSTVGSAAWDGSALVCP